MALYVVRTPDFAIILFVCNHMNSFHLPHVIPNSMQALCALNHLEIYMDNVLLMASPAIRSYFTSTIKICNQQEILSRFAQNIEFFGYGSKLLINGPIDLADKKK